MTTDSVTLATDGFVINKYSFVTQLAISIPDDKIDILLELYDAMIINAESLTITITRNVAPEPPVTVAEAVKGAVKLTKAQRRVLEVVNRNSGTISIHTFYFTTGDKRVLRTLAQMKLINQQRAGFFVGLHITEAGKIALGGSNV